MLKGQKSIVVVTLLISITILGMLYLVDWSPRKHGGAQLVVADLICVFLTENGGRWPSGWEDLAKVSEKKGLKIKELQKEVVVDFAIDGSKLLNISVNIEKVEAFNAIQPADGWPWSKEANPNHIVLDYVRQILNNINM